MQNFWKIILVIVGIIILIASIVNRKKLMKKIKQETISFVAMCISLGLALMGFVTKSTTEVTTLAWIGEQKVSLFFPLFWGFLVVFIIALIIFFRKELEITK